jgi:hypothetical protein
MSSDPQGSENHKDMLAHLEAWKLNTDIDPDIAISISVGEPLGASRIQQNFLADPFKVDQILDCRNVSITSNGVAISPLDQSPCEVENVQGNKETPVYGSIIFPKMPKVDIIPFHYEENDSVEIAQIIQETHRDKTMDTIDRCIISQVLKGKLKNRESDIKCVVFMSNVLSFPLTEMFITSMARLSQNKVAIGGCIGNLSRDSSDKVFTSLQHMLEAMDSYSDQDPNPNEYARTSGLIFAGEGVEAASIVLSTQINNRAKVDAELKKLKDCGLNEKRSCAFMFACCGRGRHFYRGKANLESQAFRKMFPDTPLLGIFGNGEIGVTYLPTIVNSPEAKKAKIEITSRDFSHSFTTIFVMLSFK